MPQLKVIISADTILLVRLAAKYVCIAQPFDSPCGYFESLKNSSKCPENKTNVHFNSALHEHH